MASNGDNQQLTDKQIVRLAAAISMDNMESIAEGYMDLSTETVKNIWRENRGKAEAFNRAVIRCWGNKNFEDQVQVPEVFITTRVRSTTGGFVCTGVCLLIRGYPSPGQGYHSPCGGTSVLVTGVPQSYLGVLQSQLGGTPNEGYPLVRSRLGYPTARIKVAH